MSLSSIIVVLNALLLKKSQNLMNIIKYFLIIVLPISILLGNLRYLIYNERFYNQLYKKTEVYKSFSDPKLIEQATDNLFGYFRGKNELDHNFFSNQAKLHLADVKNILTVTLNLFYLSLFISVILGLFLIVKKHYKDLIFSLLVSSMATVLFVAVLSAGLLSKFDFFFNSFHQLLFTNNLWIFPRDDNLIKLFPPRFFALFANRIAYQTVIVSLVILVITVVVKPKYFNDLNH